MSELLPIGVILAGVLALVAFAWVHYRLGYCAGRRDEILGRPLPGEDRKIRELR